MHDARKRREGGQVEGKGHQLERPGLCPGPRDCPKRSLRSPMCGKTPRHPAAALAGVEWSSSIRIEAYGHVMLRAFIAAVIGSEKNTGSTRSSVIAINGQKEMVVIEHGAAAG